jgi:gluconate kinase
MILKRGITACSALRKIVRDHLSSRMRCARIVLYLSNTAEFA